MCKEGAVTAADISSASDDNDHLHDDNDHLHNNIVDQPDTNEVCVTLVTKYFVKQVVDINKLIYFFISLQDNSINIERYSHNQLLWAATGYAIVVFNLI